MEGDGMNKRSAVLMALALTGALVAGGVALASGIGGPGTSAATTGSATPEPVKPVVRTTTRTVTIHRTPNQPDAGVVVLDGGASGGDGSGSERDHEGSDDRVDNSGPGSSHSGSDDSGHDDSGHDDSGHDDSGHGGDDD
jgi:hypothetical protein